MKTLGLLVLIALFSLPSYGDDEKFYPIEGELQIPKEYKSTQKTLKEREQVIPLEASQTTSPGAFGGKILEFHLASVLQNNEFKPLESVKGLENTVSTNTEIKSKNFKMKSKLEMNHLKAQVDIESFLDTKIWTEDSFKTLRTQVKLYEVDNGLVSIENKANNEDTRTYLNLKKTW